MAEQTTVLQLVLDALNLGNSISTMDDRIALQKVVCLTQEAGLQLGYGFNWYVRGPYSPALASDYYQLAAARDKVEADSKKYVLSDAAVAAVSKVKLLLDAPDGVALSRVYWLELIASIVYLVKRYKLSLDASKKKIELSKPNLLPFFDNAATKLEEVGII